MPKVITAEDRVRAQRDAWVEGYDVHVGCGGECIPKHKYVRYACHKCGSEVGVGDVMHPNGPPADDEAELLRVIDAVRGAIGRHDKGLAARKHGDILAHMCVSEVRSALEGTD